jgi:hypothetical protein
MLNTRHIKKATAATIFCMAASVAFASFTLTGTVDEKAKSSKYSLKNINHFSQKSFSLSLFRTRLQNGGSSIITPKNNGTKLNPFLQIDRGNTTYIMPYKFTIKVPKFKTPSPNN